MDMNRYQGISAKSLSAAASAAALFSVLLTTQACAAETGMKDKRQDVSASNPRERILFNADWRFHKDDPDGMDEDLSYDRLKPWVLASANAFRTGNPVTPP